MIRRAASIKIPLNEVAGIVEDVESGVMTIVLEGDRYPTAPLGMVPVCILSDIDIVEALARLRKEFGGKFL